MRWLPDRRARAGSDYITGFLTVALALLLATPPVLGDRMQAQLRLVDSRDEHEFYCLDAVGWGDHLRTTIAVQCLR